MHRATKTYVSIPEASAVSFKNAFCASGIFLLAPNPRLTPWANDIPALQAFWSCNPEGQCRSANDWTTPHPSSLPPHLLIAFGMYLILILSIA
jgi:hypothetical protein